MEAMACGVPCVGFNIGCIPEMIEHGKTGYVAEYKSSEDFAAGIGWVLESSDYQRLSEASRKKVLDNYAEDIVSTKYMALYNDLLN